jgi:hypothetical protein
VSTFFFFYYHAGCIALPQFWTEKLRHFKDVVIAKGTWCLLLVVVIAYRPICKRDHTKRDAVRRESGIDKVVHDVVLDKVGAPITDLTDKEDVRFRYSW